MAIGGACPGTVIVQTAMGIRTGPQVMLGGVLGAIAFLTTKALMSNTPSKKDSSIGNEERSTATKPETSPSTVSSFLGVNESTVLAVWELLCLVGLGLAMMLPSPSDSPALVSPIVGGVLIGLAQAATIALVKHPIGVSRAYETVGKWLLALGTGDKMLDGLITSSTAFAAGIFSGSLLLLRSGAIALDSSILEAQSISSLRAVISGVLTVFGALVAGGCTSGHAISGLATFSVSSILTTASMFAFGVLTAKLDSLTTIVI